MDPYTALTTPDLFDILTPYGLETFDSFSVLSGGIENTNYQVTLKEENTSSVSLNKKLGKRFWP